LDATKLEYFEDRLLSLQEQLLGIESLSPEGVLPSGTNTSFNRQAMVEKAFPEQQAEAQEKQEKLYEVERALDRIDEESYGLCIKCTQAIRFRSEPSYRVLF